MGRGGCGCGVAGVAGEGEEGGDRGEAGGWGALEGGRTRTDGRTRAGRMHKAQQPQTPSAGLLPSLQFSPADPFLRSCPRLSIPIQRPISVKSSTPRPLFHPTRLPLSKPAHPYSLALSLPPCAPVVLRSQTLPTVVPPPLRPLAVLPCLLPPRSNRIGGSSYFNCLSAGLVLFVIQVPRRWRARRILNLITTAGLGPSLLTVPDESPIQLLTGIGSCR